MELLKVILAGILGTILMTGFSYMLARLKNQEFREPRLLNMILRRSTYDKVNPSNNSILGWVVHFSIGIILMTLFYIIHLIFSFNITITSIFFYGIFAGILSILSWHLMFIISPNSENVLLREFYIQILVAHVLFAMGAAIFIF
ncbi:hypothetical protein C8P64_0653 [Christiangramia gaetbulicola]|uniref:DUF2938 domain-containing protein n=1 Tax=Christiangramia gaetbulicola TaxID=703340 RepID=A0A2T6ALI0_9FLAO|nr:hypothetical protein [Christiangramia gaetbulicola]PTX44671.1 hypothetical protein C8P64_0653 [Christiangramia gaetbulicola]